MGKGFTKCNPGGVMIYEKIYHETIVLGVAMCLRGDINADLRIVKFNRVRESTKNNEEPKYSLTQAPHLLRIFSFLKGLLPQVDPHFQLNT
jgi:hypothetical protein